jgi:hypothetical protein
MANPAGQQHAADGTNSQRQHPWLGQLQHGASMLPMVLRQDSGWFHVDSAHSPCMPERLQLRTSRRAGQRNPATPGCHGLQPAQQVQGQGQQQHGQHMMGQGHGQGRNHKTLAMPNSS